MMGWGLVTVVEEGPGSSVDDLLGGEGESGGGSEVEYVGEEATADPSRAG
jgi:hypothetical protein